MLSEGLSPVSTFDSTQLILEPSLPEAIQTGLRLDHIPVYDERWYFDHNVSQYLKASFIFIKGTPVTKRCWEEDLSGTHFVVKEVTVSSELLLGHIWKLQQPMSPILTKASRRETPQLGSRRAQHACPDSQVALVKSVGMRKLPVPQIGQTPEVDIGEALYAHILSVPGANSHKA